MACQSLLRPESLLYLTSCTMPLLRQYGSVAASITVGPLVVYILVPEQDAQYAPYKVESTAGLPC